LRVFNMEIKEIEFGKLYKFKFSQYIWDPVIIPESFVINNKFDL